MGNVVDFPFSKTAGFLVCHNCDHKNKNGEEVEADWGAVIRHSSDGFPFVAALVCANCGTEVLLINGYMEEWECS